MRPKGTAAELEARRRVAVGLVERGMRPVDAARAVGTSRGSMTRWMQGYRKGGEGGLTAKPHLGKRPKLTPRQRERLAKLLLEGPRRLGYRTQLWTLARVAEVIERRFAVKYHPGHVWYLLRSMGWSYQKTERRARERDEEAIARWRAREWPRIKRRPKDRPNDRVRG